ncbi:MAG: TonB-dependent receptor domain-containing protein [Candidatus Eiseniibacteriota bacterium]
MLASCLLACFVASAFALPVGKIGGRIVGTDTGEPIGFADILLIPADTTLHKVGGLTNADGTYLLQAAPGRYTLQIRALSYSTKRIEGLELKADVLLPFDTAIAPEAIQQQEVVVEAKAKTNTEASMLAARRKASSVGDAVSAEQVRKSPDKDAAEVLKRVTGLSVQDNKYVYVRGLGERYSSTEVDGVRIASPEQNKRVVPLDLVPATLLENIVVQKTYTADRPGEFGGGDVQVRTKDFPGARTWSISAAMGANQDVTFHDHLTYLGSRADFFGFGADARKIPQEVYDVAGDLPLVFGNPRFGPFFNKATLATVAKSFSNVWSPYDGSTMPNTAINASYGDEFKLFGHPLGLVQSWALRRSTDVTNSSQRLFAAGTDTTYDYKVEQSKESVMLGGVAGVSYRLSPRHSLHLRGLYTNSADDEIRIYTGQDHNRVNGVTGTWLEHSDTRLMYLERTVASGAVEGQHEFALASGTNVDWKLTRSRARRQQPDRREYIYDHNYSYNAQGQLFDYWSLGSRGTREYGDLKEDGWGGNLTGTFHLQMGALGKGKLIAGYDRQSKERENFYRRFNVYANTAVPTAVPPESIFSDKNFNGSTTSGYVDEATLAVDNYSATQLVTAGFLTADLPFGSHVHANVGVRQEHGQQNVRTFDLFNPGVVVIEGKLDNIDWLPAANLTWLPNDKVNLRLGASRTLSRPDLNELSPSPSLEYVGGYLLTGNPALKRARLDNYDVRVETFPGISEVVALGFFYKKLHDPIEQIIQGGSPPVLIPKNSQGGHNLGGEFEARSSLGRIVHSMRQFSVNLNCSVISSEVTVAKQITNLTTQVHPLQGQANYLANAGLVWTSRSGTTDVSLLASSVGVRLHTLAYNPLPDIYDRAYTTLDFALNFVPFRNTRMKFGAKNLLDPAIQQLQGYREVSSYHNGREYGISFTVGS